NPRDLEEIWRDQFDWVYREYDYAVFPMTIHPDVSGRPQVLMMLERLYAHIVRHPGVRFATFDQIADDFARRSPRRRGGRTTDDGPIARLSGALRLAEPCVRYVGGSSKRGTGRIDWKGLSPRPKGRRRGAKVAGCRSRSPTGFCHSSGSRSGTGTRTPSC